MIAAILMAWSSASIIAASHFLFDAGFHQQPVDGITGGETSMAICMANQNSGVSTSALPPNAVLNQKNWAKAMKYRTCRPAKR